MEECRIQTTKKVGKRARKQKRQNERMDKVQGLLKNENPIIIDLAESLAQTRTDILATSQSQLSVSYHSLIESLVEVSNAAQHEVDRRQILLNTHFLPLGQEVLAFSYDDNEVSSRKQDAQGENDACEPGVDISRESPTTAALLKDCMKQLELRTKKHEETIQVLWAEWEACRALIRSAATELGFEMRREEMKVTELIRTGDGLVTRLGKTCDDAVMRFKDAETVSASFFHFLRVVLSTSILVGTADNSGRNTT